MAMRDYELGSVPADSGEPMLPVGRLRRLMRMLLAQSMHG